MPEHEITLGEVVRRLEAIATKLDHFESRHESTYLRKDASDAIERINTATHADFDERLAKIESRSEWLVRTVGALIIAALLGVVLASNRPSATSAAPSTGTASIAIASTTTAHQETP